MSLVASSNDKNLFGNNSLWYGISCSNFLTYSLLEFAFVTLGFVLRLSLSSRSLFDPPPTHPPSPTQYTLHLFFFRPSPFSLHHPSPSGSVSATLSSLANFHCPLMHAQLAHLYLSLWRLPPWFLLSLLPPHLSTNLTLPVPPPPPPLFIVSHESPFFKSLTLSSPILHKMLFGS